MDNCNHKFVFLRHDRDARNDGFDRNPIWISQDVFFCEKCLEYQRVDMLKRTPRNDGSGYYETRLK